MTKILIDEATVKLVLEALEHCKDVIVERGLNGNPEFAERWGLTLPLDRSKEAITALKALAAQPAQQEPVISTAHGPWIPSTHPGEEGESYCKRCLLRDKFLGSRQCDPHIVPPEQPAHGCDHCSHAMYAGTKRKPLTDEAIVKITSDPCLYIRGGDYRIDIARAIEAAHGIKENT